MSSLYVTFRKQTGSAHYLIRAASKLDTCLAGLSSKGFVHHTCQVLRDSHYSSRRRSAARTWLLQMLLLNVCDVMCSIGMARELSGELEKGEAKKVDNGSSAISFMFTHGFVVISENPTCVRTLPFAPLNCIA